ncbi:helix-turn-helix domain-containing protein [Nitrosopumilus sp.]|uniref:ArsR/SmtB family transcription factor n=1 Tax=Nitrosopumilus sp. TaxID=2024843 RepID=UPI0026392607|nr:helix-turn-helix domain-containing protein [Nitrosopumilus sp.]
MSVDENPDELTEKIKILATDDEKIKSFGELFTNDSSREILQLLFNEELSATQISQKTEISLQLVKYHLNKLQDLGVVKISKIEKNSKSQDMKIYTASKFSIVIVPPKLSEKTRESKLLVRSFRHIYKVAGLGIATGISGLLSAFQLEQPNSVVVDDPAQFASEMSEKQLQFSESAPESSARIAAAPVAESDLDDSAANLESDEVVEFQNFANEEAIQMTSASSSELFLPLVIITTILGGLTIFYLVKYFKK